MAYWTTRSYCLITFQGKNIKPTAEPKVLLDVYIEQGVKTC